MKITQDRLKEICTYDPQTGEFIGIINRGKAYKAGTVMGYPDSDGYLVATIDNHPHKLHRLAWLYVHGSCPSGQIDHKNGVRTDNRLDNLRLATASEQAFNKPVSRISKSGVKGVFYVPRNGKWRARVKINGILVLDKTFSLLEDAKLAATKAREDHHGDFARH